MHVKLLERNLFGYVIKNSPTCMVTLRLNELRYLYPHSLYVSVLQLNEVLVVCETIHMCTLVAGAVTSH